MVFNGSICQLAGLTLCSRRLELSCVSSNLQTKRYPSCSRILEMNLLMTIKYVLFGYLKCASSTNISRIQYLFFSGGRKCERPIRFRVGCSNDSIARNIKKTQNRINSGFAIFKITLSVFCIWSKL